MTTVKRRTLLALLAAGVTATAVPQTAGASPPASTTAAPTAYRLVLPEPTGPYRIGTTELHLVDNSRVDPWVPGRKRELMISVWYPAMPGARGPRAPYAPPHAAVPLADQVGAVIGLKPGQIDYAGTPTHARTGVPSLGRHPVILYSPGMGTSRLMGTNHVEDLVSRGYVVVTMDHTGEAPVEFPGGRVAPAAMPNSQDVIKPATAVRVADTRFVLDNLQRLEAGANPDSDHRRLPKGLGRALDLRRTGMFGYSLGGFAAAETMLVDRRIDAGVNLDGTLQYGHPDLELSEVAKQGLDRPFLLFASQHHTHLPQPGSPYEDRSWVSFWQHQRGWKLDLRLPEGTHGAFADFQFAVPGAAKAYGVPAAEVEALLGNVDPDRSVAAQRAYLGAYFDQFLKGRPQRLLVKESPRYPDVEFVR
ncbi:lipase [Kribbella sp. VKM Ac-2568]|uniref:alpha/beta hydrolase family protein n=1 Tax=Kribbella sp. VKM Ac-2568 TaxID=2512219 RepID=UPI001052ED82|nr:lipase [Kribbella sp. VKM Ac-2568]TCM49091.1 hypothetical protein EV648_103360 [Kribbella sp. VKM Ac-2568]